MRVDIMALRKSYGSVEAVRGVDLSLAEGELFTLLGPSGCGKTTTLRCLAGLEQPDSGRVGIGGKDCTRVPAFRRPCAMVFQSYALYPHMTVYDNIAYGLWARKYNQGGPLTKVAVLAPGGWLRRDTGGDVDRRVRDAAALLGLPQPLLTRTPGELSGGQQQRVALARALIMEPEVLLLDEPLSNLDAKLRVRVREEIRRLQQRLRITTLYVTHDQEEALSISDRIGVMRDGVLLQVGSPAEVYENPASSFVADFLGLANIFDGRVVRTDADGLAEVAVANGPTLRAPAGRFRAGQSVKVVIRPDGFTAPNGSVEATVLAGTVTLRTFLGSVARYGVELAGLPFTVDVPVATGLYAEGASLALALAPRSVLLLAD